MKKFKNLFIFLFFIFFPVISFADGLPIYPDIEEVFFYGDYINSILITLFLEFILALIIVKLKKLPLRILSSVILANALSITINYCFIGYITEIDYTFFWFWFSSFHACFFIFIIEVFTVLFEAYLIFLFNRKNLNFSSALFLSLMINLASFLLWLGVYFFQYYLYVQEITSKKSFTVPFLP